MKTSGSQPSTKSRRQQKRLAGSFLFTCLVYLPVFVFVWATVPAPEFKAAGDRTIAISFAQISGGGAVASDPAPQPEPQEEMQPEPAPAPEPEPEPQVQPEPKPQAAVVPKKPEPKRAVQQKPPKKEAVKPKKKEPAPKREEKPVQKSQEPPAAASQALSDAPAPVKTGAATASDQGGISTMIYGESDDPFLARVKRSVESVLRYPRRARQLRLEGAVMVQFVVQRDGTLAELEIHASSGQKMLDKLALRSVQDASSRWGAPERVVRIRLPVRYELR